MVAGDKKFGVVSHVIVGGGGLSGGIFAQNWENCSSFSTPTGCISCDIYFWIYSVTLYYRQTESSVKYLHDISYVNTTSRSLTCLAQPSNNSNLQGLGYSIYWENGRLGWGTMGAGRALPPLSPSYIVKKGPDVSNYDASEVTRS